MPEVTQQPSWDDLSVRGKGVMVVKMKEADRSCYYLVRGSSRVIPLRFVKNGGKKFASLEPLVEFTKRKPADVFFFEAPPGSLSQDGAGELEALSLAERKSIFGPKGSD